MSLFKNMRRKGLAPNVIIYTTLLRGLLSVGSFRAAQNLINEMETHGIIPNHVTYITLLDGLCQNDCIPKAMKIFQDMISSNFNPSIEIFGILIDGMCRVGEIGKAKLLFGGISSYGLVPDVITYTIMIKGLCNEGLLEANELFLQMEEHGCLTNTHTFNVIIRCFCKINEMHKAFEFLHIMAKGDISPDADTISIVVNFLAKDEQFKKHIELLPTFFAKGGGKSDEVQLISSMPFLHILGTSSQDPSTI